MGAEPTAEQRVGALGALSRCFGRRDPDGADAILAFVLAGQDEKARERRETLMEIVFADERLPGLCEALAEAERLVAYVERAAGAPTDRAA